MNISLAFAPENVVYARQVQPSRPASARSFSTSQAESSIWSLPAGSFPCLPLPVTVWHLSRHSSSGQSRVYRVTHLRTPMAFAGRGSAGTGPAVVVVKVARVTAGVYSGNPVHTPIMKMRPSALTINNTYCYRDKTLSSRQRACMMYCGEAGRYPGLNTDRLNTRNELLHRFFPFIK